MFRYRIKSRKNNLLYRSMLIAFLAIALLPLIFGVIMYIKAENTIQEQIYQYNEVLMSNVSSELDKYYSEIEILCNQISENETLNELMENDSVTQDDVRNKSLKLMNDLVSRTNNYSYINNIYVYIEKADMIVTMNEATPLIDFFENGMVKFVDYDFDSWKDKYFSGVQYKQYFPQITLAAGNSKQSVFLYGQSFPSTNVGNIKARIYLLIDVPAVLRRVQMSGANEGEFLLVDKNQNILISSEENMGLWQQIIGEVKNKKSGVAKSIDGKCVAVYSRSRQSGWISLYIVSKESFLMYSRKFMGWVFAVLLFYSIVIMAMIPFIVRKLYAPINNVLIKLRNIGSTAETDDTKNNLSEMDFIAHRVDELDSIIYRQVAFGKKEFLKKMLLEEIVFDTDCLKVMEILEIELPYKAFCVLIIEINGMGVFKNDGGVSEHNLRNGAVINMFHEIVETAGNWKSYETEHKNIAAIINIDCEDETAWKAELRRICEGFREKIAEHLQLGVYIGVSSLEDDLKNVSMCYREALTALEFNFYESECNILFYDEIKKEDNHRYFYSYEDENKLMNYTKQGDYEAVCELLDEIVAANVRAGMTKNTKKCLYYDFTGTWMKIANWLRVDKERNLQDIRNCYDEDESIQDLTKTVKEMYQYLCETAGKAKLEQLDKKINQYEEYIKENYQDYNLSASMIGNHFNVSRQSVYNLFKQEFGMTPSEYIAYTRIEKAKEFLANTSMSNVQIANMVGFSSDTTFVRTFKKHEGVSPKSYREMHKN